MNKYIILRSEKVDPYTGDFVHRDLFLYFVYGHYLKWVFGALFYDTFKN